jgi:hypothetical protein
MMSKIWFISQTANRGYETFDGAVVIADTEQDARNISPEGHWDNRYSSWAPTPDHVSAMYIGEAAPDQKVGSVVLSSFNAG